MREQLRSRGYEEIKTPQIMDAELWHRSGHWDNYRENMFFAEPSERDRDESDRAYARAADELPRRLPRVRLRAPLLPRPAAAPGRVRPGLALRARGGAARPAARARLHPGRRPRLLHARAGRPTRSTRSARRSTSSTRASASTRCGSSSRPSPRSRSAPTSSGRRRPTALRRGARAQGREYELNPGDGTFYGPEDRLPRHRRARPLVAVRHLPARLLHARALRAQPTRARTTPSTAR